MDARSTKENTRKFQLLFLSCAMSFACTVPSIASAYSLKVLPPVQTTAAIRTDAPILQMGTLREGPSIASGLFGDTLKSVKSNKSLLLWSMYPAGVRGRVFGGVGGDPLLHSGGGW